MEAGMRWGWRRGMAAGDGGGGGRRSTLRDMAEPKTRPTDASVEEFLDAVANERRRHDARTIDSLMRAATGEAPVIWGTSIVGYGAIAHSGSRGTMRSWPVVAFSPRKAELVLYLNTALEEAAFERLGPHRRGVGCVYLKGLDGVDRSVLEDIIRASVQLAHSRSA